MPRARHVLVSLSLSITGVSGPPEAVAYRRPVEAPVLEGFVPPSTPYGPGNRGLEFATRPGDPVRAAAPGVVTFAGAVGGERFVTVLHADRIRTTYGWLRSVAVAPGEHLSAGEVLGAAGARLIWTARLGRDAYLDPAVLLAASGRPLVHLVPDQQAGGRSGRARAASARPTPVSRAAAEWALG